MPFEQRMKEETMGSPQRPTNSASSLAATSRRRGPPWAVLLAGVMVSWAATSPAPVHADEDLGTWTGNDLPDGVSTSPSGDKSYHVFKDSHGKYYLSNPAHGINRAYMIKGTTVHWSNNGVAGQGVQPAPPPGSPADQFDKGINDFIIKEIPGLTPMAPGVGTNLFSLELSPALRSLGDGAQLWGELSPSTSTNGVIGLDQGASLLSVLGSSTPDGLTPVLYQFNPEMIGFNLTLSGTNELTFDSGNTYVPPQQGADYLISGSAVPEPASFILMLGGIAVVGAWLMRGDRLRRKTSALAGG
jgi:PEP-CTERM motif